MRSVPFHLVVVLVALFASGCALHTRPAAGPAAPAGNVATCMGSPTASPGTFRHKRSRVLAAVGQPRHRGVDLIAVEGDENQTLGGKFAYTAADKDLEDEDVEVFACARGRWRALASARTDGDGRFAVALVGAARLPVGMTELYARVVGDGTGVRFLGYVAAAGESVIVSDVDGTITESENAIFRTVVRGSDIGHQPAAPVAFAQSGRTVVYVTARGDQYTEITRQWLRAHGFPPGPLRLAASAITLPGSRTVAFKTATLRALRVPIAAGIGNRSSDIKAYTNVGLSPRQIFINLPEFTTELRQDLVAGNATPFDDYRDLTALLR